MLKEKGTPINPSEDQNNRSSLQQPKESQKEGEFRNAEAPASNILDVDDEKIKQDNESVGEEVGSESKNTTTNQQVRL